MKYKIKKGLAFRRIDGAVFIVDAARSEMRELNGAASVIWEGLAAGRSEAAIVSELTGEFDVDGGTARADLDAFIAELSGAGLLETAAK